MAERADALIIGGGVIGASIAWHLTRQGRKPVVFDRGLLGSGNTGRSAGGIRAQFTTETNIKLSLYSIAFYERFKEILGADAEFHQVGYLFLAVTPEQRKQFEARVAFQRKLGVEVSFLGREEVAKRWPFLVIDDVTGATWSAKDGFAGPYEVTIAFANAAKRGGALFHEQAEVTEIVAERGRIRGLKTSLGEFSSDVVVAAAGPAVPALVKPLGIDDPGHRMELHTTSEDDEAAQCVWQDERLDRYPEVIGLNSGGAFGAAKHWPVEHFADTIILYYY